MDVGTFRGKKVLVTGAAGVFGDWIVKAFHDEGAELFCTDYRFDALESQARKISAGLDRLHLYEDDLGNDSSLSELVTACLFATVPTSRSPSLASATTEGVVLPPSEFSITRASPASITATHEFVVPKSIPMTRAILSISFQLI